MLQILYVVVAILIFFKGKINLSRNKTITKKQGYLVSASFLAGAFLVDLSLLFAAIPVLVILYFFFTSKSAEQNLTVESKNPKDGNSLDKEYGNDKATIVIFIVLILIAILVYNFGSFI